MVLRAVPACSSTPTAPGVDRSRRTPGQLTQRLGNVEQVRSYFTTTLEILDGLGTRIEPDEVRRALAQFP